MFVCSFVCWFVGLLIVFVFENECFIVCLFDCDFDYFVVFVDLIVWVFHLLFVGLLDCLFHCLVDCLDVCLIVCVVACLLACFCLKRLENIDEAGCWIESESFYCEGQLIYRKAGEKAGAARMKRWRQLRLTHPELFIGHWVFFSFF